MEQTQNNEIQDFKSKIQMNEQQKNSSKNIL